jgi:pimeloyl-ACP methyl ester carboxylesterase
MSGSRVNAIFSVSLLILGVSACSDDDKPGTDTADSAVEATPDSGEGNDSGNGGGNDAGTDGGDDPDQVEAIPAELALPIVFVHGFAGSASQYESQAIRFVANGYPAERILAYDHDGQGTNFTGYVAGVDEVIDKALEDFGTDKVYLAGHSRGTFVSSMYLGNAARAAKVAKYISLDGSGCAGAEAAGVPCIAPSQMNLPGQKHVEVATSKECFVEQFKFLIGREPAVVDIVKQDTPVEISGRVVNFPANTGRAGTTLKFWPIDADTGARTGTAPLETFSIGEDGNWGPAVVDPDKHYELELTAPDSGTQHFYPQRFLRSSHLVRLLSGPPDAPARMNTNTSDKHAAVTALRMREWTADDVLNVETSSPSGGDQAAVNTINAETGARNSIGYYLHDDAATPGMTTTAVLPWFSMQAFQSGVDVFMPASDPPDGTITITNLPRGDDSKPQVLNFPNWASSKHTIMAIFADYPQP